MSVLSLQQVKSRVMGDKEGLYKGTVDCFIKTFRNDVSGPPMLRGFVSSYWTCKNSLSLQW